MVGANHRLAIGALVNMSCEHVTLTIVSTKNLLGIFFPHRLNIFTMWTLYYTMHNFFGLCGKIFPFTLMEHSNQINNSPIILFKGKSKRKQLHHPI
jgi:hypothetical protein